MAAAASFAVAAFGAAGDFGITSDARHMVTADHHPHRLEYSHSNARGFVRFLFHYQEFWLQSYHYFSIRQQIDGKLAKKIFLRPSAYLIIYTRARKESVRKAGGS